MFALATYRDSFGDYSVDNRLSLRTEWYHSTPQTVSTLASVDSTALVACDTTTQQEVKSRWSVYSVRRRSSRLKRSVVSHTDPGAAMGVTQSKRQKTAGDYSSRWSDQLGSWEQRINLVCSSAKNTFWWSAALYRYGYDVWSFTGDGNGNGGSPFSAVSKASRR